MSRSFTTDTVVFGAGEADLAANHLVARGAGRVLLVCQGHHRGGADRLAAQLGDRCVGVFAEVAQHVPTALVDRARATARELGADWVVAHGGGSATGLAKAIALTEDVRVGAVVTTYSGSERTSIWGMTGPDGKRTGRDPRVRPALVIYDPLLTLALPRDLSLRSLFNSLAHVIGELWTGGSDSSADAVRHLLAGIDGVAADPTDVEARTEAMYGAYLAAAAIERVPLALQHAFAHSLGGTFDTPHAATHAAVLPYATAFNGRAVPAAMAALSALGEDPPAALYDRIRALGLAHDLKGLGLTRADLPRLVQGVLSRGYGNPRPVTAVALALLVDDAYHSRRPSLVSRRRRLDGVGPHAALHATERGVPLTEARAVVIAVHGRGASADRICNDLEQHLPDREGLCMLAPQAVDNAWYPLGFTAPIAENQPFLDSALGQLDAAFAAATAVVPPERVVLVGFSQGACLALSWARSRPHAPRALLALSGAALDVAGDYENLAGSTVYLSKSEGDPWIPGDRFERTRAALAEVVSELEVVVEPGDGHRITAADGAALRVAVGRALT
ncbi:MAG: maleylacetate reductase [Myxococcota bacterium]|jgi:maleylacetate reductase